MPMTSNRPIVDEYGKYSIGDAAKRLGINRETLRRYAKMGFVDFELVETPSTIPGRETRTYFSFTGKALLDLWQKRRKVR